MCITKWHTDEGLWNSALILVKGQHYTEAFDVMIAIATRSLQFISGKSALPLFSVPLQKRIEENEIHYMQSLSKEIAELVEHGENEKAADRISEYLGHFIFLLSDSQPQTEKLTKTVLRILIEAKITESNQIFKINEPGEVYKLAADSAKIDYVTTSEAAEIGGVSDQTIRRWCEKGRFAGAYQTEGGHWRIPQKHLKVTFQQAVAGDGLMKKIDDDTQEQLGGDMDEFDIDIDYS